MQRLLLPLCMIGLLLGAGTATALMTTWSQIQEGWSAMGFSSETMRETTILKEQEEDPTAVGPLYLDVENGSWYKPYVAAASRMGIVSGYGNEDGSSNGLFGPSDTVTVAQVLKMTVRASGRDETLCIEPSDYALEHGNEDYYAAAERHWSKTFIGCALQQKFRLMKGLPDLERPALRGEVIGLIHDAFGIKAPPLTALYADTKGHLYEADIAFATVQQVVSGDFSNGEAANIFRPNQQLNRAEAAKMIIESIEAYGRRGGSRTSSSARGS